MAESACVADLSELLNAFDEDTMYRLAPDRVIRRGQKVWGSGAVAITALTPTTAAATVQGTQTYEVRLGATDHPDWSCTCPAAADGDFCKHYVAVAIELAMTDTEESDPPLVLAADAQPTRGTTLVPSGTPADAMSDERARLVEYVSRLPTDRLVALVVDQTDADWRLRAELLREAEKGERGDLGAIDVGTWMRRIDDAMHIRDYVDWREADVWASDVFFVLDAIGDLLDRGRAEAVIQLAEHAFRTVEGAIGYVDDSHSGCLVEISARVADLHLQACRERPPDPVTLARRLVDLELHSELGGLFHALTTYNDLLGDDGLAEYGRLVDGLGEGNNDTSRGYAVKAMRRAYAEALNDVDALVAELRRDPRQSDVVTVMSLLAEAGRVDEAIDAGRDGLARFRSQWYSTTGIIDALADLLRRRGDADEAIRLYADDFDAHPSLSTLQRLLDSVHPDDRAQRRDEMIESIRVRVSRPGRGQPRVPNDLLVEVLMWAGRAEEAWDAANAGGCLPARWMALAAARETSHPLDAIDVYEPQVIRSIETTTNGGYASAVELMERIRPLAHAAGVPQRFDDLVVTARTKYKRKRNLQKLLDQQGW